MEAITTTTKPNYTPRKYQIALAEEAIQRNTICVLPTGSGKTMVASLLIDHLYHEHLMKRCSDGKYGYGSDNLIAPTCSCGFLNDNNIKTSKISERRKTFFLVPTNTLKKQQRDALYNYTKRRKCSAVKVKKDFTYDSGSDWNVMVCTPAHLLNTLNDRDSGLKMSDILLIVFDEAHHTCGDHPYHSIMTIYNSLLALSNFEPQYDYVFLRDVKKEHIVLPKVLGLTATPSFCSLHK